MYFTLEQDELEVICPEHAKNDITMSPEALFNHLKDDHDYTALEAEMCVLGAMKNAEEDEIEKQREMAEDDHLDRQIEMAKRLF